MSNVSDSFVPCGSPAVPVSRVRGEGPDVGPMLSWLKSGGPIREDGAVLSWINSAHPGYDYPEIAGLALRLLSIEGRSMFLCDRIAAALSSKVSPWGGTGKEGREYAFDSAMVLGGLLTLASKKGAITTDPELLSRLFNFECDCVRRKVAMTDCSASARDHWSVRYGAHLLKLSFTLREYPEIGGAPPQSELLEVLTCDVLSLFDGRRFRTQAGSRWTYLHSHCYALEGLLGLGEERSATAQAALCAGAAWLAELQTANGGIPAWHDGRQASGNARTDATAQALRIWCAVDRINFSQPIGRALHFLRMLQSPQGGLFYEPGSQDVNTWATVFAIQGMEWAREGPRPAELV